MAVQTLELPTRTDPWARNQPGHTAYYRLSAVADPDVPCRVFNLLAQQYLQVEHAHLQQTHELLHMELAVANVPWHRAELLAERLRALVLVHDVTLGGEPQQAALA